MNIRLVFMALVGGIIGCDLGGKESGPPEPSYPECVEPGDVTVQFTITIDGVANPEITDRTWPGQWPFRGPDIDGPCDVMNADAAARILSLMCDDPEGAPHTVEITFQSDPAVSFVLDPGPVDLHFDYAQGSDEIAVDPPTLGHAFAVSQGGTVRLAGIDGEYGMFYPHDLPVEWSTEPGLCAIQALDECYEIERHRGTFEVDGQSAQLFDGDSAALGTDLLLVVDRLEGSPPSAPSDDWSCGAHPPPNFLDLRFLIGAPI